MVTSVVSSLPYFSYLDQLQGKNNVTQNPATPTTPATPASNNSASASSTLVSSLLGGSSNSFSPSVLSVLQGSDGNFDPIATIFGGKSADNGVAKLYANLYDTSSASALQQAKLQNPKVAAADVTSFNFITDAVKASTAYNNTLQQNVAAAVAQGKAQTLSLLS